MNTFKIIKLNCWSMHFVVSSPPCPAPRGPGTPHYRVFTMTLWDTPHSVGLLWASDQPVAEKNTLTTNNTHQRQAALPPAGFETSIPASDRPQTNALDRAATGIGFVGITITYIWFSTDCGLYNVVKFSFCTQWGTWASGCTVPLIRTLTLPKDKLCYLK